MALTNNPRAISATADGLLAGVIRPDDDWVTITSGNADHIVTLPDATKVAIGKVIRGNIGSTTCEMRTPASSNQTINNVDADGSQEMALVASGSFRAEKQTATNWIVECFTAAGVRTIPTPD